MKTILLTLFCWPVLLLAQQTVNYNDVAVIVNDNSQTSIDIGNYFQQARSIPAANMIHINASTTEEIDSLEFESIRQQIEAYLTSNNLIESINYLVTTKGVPLRVDRPGSPDVLHPDLYSSSVDTELALILGTLSGAIASHTFISNPYYEATTDFSRGDFGIYLVTRLTGYTKNDVYDLIDRSGPNTGVNQLSAQFLFDMANQSNQNLLDIFAYASLQTVDSLNAKNWQTIFDSTQNMLTNQAHLVGYYGIIGPMAVYTPNHTWTEGSIAYMGNDFAATTFNPNHPYSNTAFLADLIAEGATGGLSTAYYSYTLNTSDANKMFDYYADTTLQFNLAESAYAALNSLSSWWVVVGDPKASITIDNFASVKPEENTEFSIYPNPIASGNLMIEGDFIEEVSIFSLDGRLVLETGVIDGGVNIDALPKGTYVVLIYGKANRYTTKLIKH